MHLFQPGDAATPFRPHLANDKLTTRGKLLHTCGEVNQEGKETSLVLSFPDGRGLLAAWVPIRRRAGHETNCMELERIKVAFSFRFHQSLVISHHGFASINLQLIK